MDMAYLSSILEPLEATEKDGTCQFCGKPQQYAACPTKRGKVKVPICCGCPGSLRAWKSEQKQLDRDHMQKRAERNVEAQIACCGVGEHFASASLEVNEAFGYYATHFEQMLGEGVGLFVTGCQGSFKTTGACAVVLYLVRRQYRCRFDTGVDIMNTIRGSFGSEESTQKVVARYTTPDLLVIDDVGKERIGDFSLEQFFMIINGRYANNKPMIITTQLTTDELIKHWTLNGNDKAALAFVSRISETFLAVDMGNVDRRRK